MKTKSVLLEPMYDFRLEVPSDVIGRAMTDIRRMNGEFASPIAEGGMSVLTGSVPVACMQNYGREVTSYTRGRGQLFCSWKGYEPCHNEEEVIEAIGYDAESDLDNPTGSVFCTHGAGFAVPWDQVDDYAHVDSGLHLSGEEEDDGTEDGGCDGYAGSRYEGEQTGYSSMVHMDRELEAIFERTYGPVKRRRAFESVGSVSYRSGDASDREDGSGSPASRNASSDRKAEGERSAGRSPSCIPCGEEYLLVDGYNIIFSWEELKELSKVNLEAARGRLQDILSNYQGYRKMTLILVFDAYKVEGGVGEIFKYHNIHVVYTKEAETADQYIEKTVHAMGKGHSVTVATSDALEQVIIMGAGARRMSAQEFLAEVRQTEQEIRREHLHRPAGSKNYLFDGLDDDLANQMERIRLGQEKE